MKLFLSFSMLLCFSLSGYCSDPVTANFCNNTSNTITITEFMNCNEVTVNDANWTIKSFTISYELNGILHEEDVIGSTIPSAFQNDVQSNAPNQISIKDIVLENASNTEKPIKSITIKLMN